MGTYATKQSKLDSLSFQLKKTQIIIRDMVFLCAFSNQSADVQFFGATTLHTKLSRHWHEIPKENREELRQKLFQSIVLYAAGPKVVLSRLCICVCLHAYAQGFKI